MPDAAHDGRNVALNYQVTCWCPKEPIYCLALFVHYNICIHCAHVSLHRSMCQLMAVYVYHFNIVCVCVTALLRRVPCTFTDFCCMDTNLESAYSPEVFGFLHLHVYTHDSESQYN